MAFIGKKANLQNECYKKTKHNKFSEKQIFLTPWYALFVMEPLSNQRVRSAYFSENLACFVFL